MPDPAPAGAPPAPDPAAPPFSGTRLDRAATQRHDAEWVAAAFASPAARAVAASGDGVLLGEPHAALVRLEPPLPSEAEPVLLGLDGTAPLFALDLDSLGEDRAARLRHGGRIVALRDAGTLLPRAEAGLAAYTVALLGWHRRHGFCANCGAGTAVVEGGFARRCDRCGATHFPRTDPVVIMLVEHDRRLLLGRRPGWPADRYSVLAGFVSPGETAEEAVVREVREESAIEVCEPVFVTSQPWPFPSSLMLGFEARSAGGDPVSRDGELEDVRWFAREEVRAAALGRGGSLALPPRVSIARFLIDGWLARP